MKTKRTIYHYSPFKNDAYGHGGCKRTNQIVDLIIKSNDEIYSFDLDPTIKKGLFDILSNIIYGLYYQIILRLPFVPSLVGLIKVGHYSRLCVRELSTIQEKSTIVIEDFCRLGAILSVLSKRKGFNVMGVVHNIESLVPEFKSSFSKRKAPRFFNEELFFIKQCDSVYTISREENWLLQLHNINSYYLPYCPTSDVYNELQNIAKNRSHNNGRGFVLGTVLNPPTQNGMIDLINALEKNQISADVAGFGTEVLIDKCPELRYVKIHGAISFEKMSGFLSENKFFVVNQPYTSGVLTRIIESLLAGIPVVGNESALRSYHYLPGVYECDFQNLVLPDISDSSIDINEYLDVLKRQESLFLKGININ